MLILIIMTCFVLCLAQQHRLGLIFVSQQQCYQILLSVPTKLLSFVDFTPVEANNGEIYRVTDQNLLLSFWVFL